MFFPIWTLKELLCLNICKAPGPDAIYPFLLRTFAHHICVPLSLVYSNFWLKVMFLRTVGVLISPQFVRREIGHSPVFTGMSVSLVLFIRLWNLLLKSLWLVSSVVSLWSDCLSMAFIRKGLVSQISWSSWKMLLFHWIGIRMLMLFSWISRNHLTRFLTSVFCLSWRIWVSVVIYCPGSSIGFVIGNSVVVSGCASSWQEVTSGVPKGLCWVHLLFVSFINDIDADILCTAKKFADDTKLYSEVSSKGDSKKFQMYLDKVSLGLRSGKCFSILINARWCILVV